MLLRDCAICETPIEPLERDALGRWVCRPCLAQRVQPHPWELTAKDRSILWALFITQE